MKSAIFGQLLLILLCNFNCFSITSDRPWRLDSLAGLSRSVMVSFPDSSRRIAFELYELSNKLNNEWGKAQSQILIGASLHRQSKFDSAIFYFDAALEINRTHADTLQIATSKLNKAMCLVSTGRYEEGAENVLHSMQLSERILDKEPMAQGTYIRCFNIMGQVFYYQGDFEKTKDYFEMFLNEATKANDTLLIASANNNLGAVYYEMGDYDKSLEYDLKGAEIHKQLNNPIGYANAMQNIATDLLERDELIKAEKYLKEALVGYQKVPNEKGVSEVYYNLGILAMKRRNYTFAIEWFEKAMELASQINNPDVLKNGKREVASAYAESGRYQMAYDSFKMFHHLSDSLSNLTHRSKVSELEIAYEAEKNEILIEKQEATILQKELELERNRALMTLLGIGVFSVAGFGILFYKRNQYKANIAIEVERSELKAEQIKAVIESQEAERTRFAMDLHDDFGQLISALRLKVNQNSGKDIETNQMLDKMYLSLKNIAFNLMPQTLVEGGLVDAVNELCGQLNKLGNMNIQVRAFEVDELAIAPNKVALYRILQEVLNNIMKYASASKVSISLTGLGNELSIMIEDNGTGFDVNTLTLSKGNGWRNIASRLDLMNGTFEVDSTEGQPNSTVSIVIPYLSEAKRVA